MREQRPAGARPRLQPFVTPLRKGAVTRQHTIAVRFPNMEKFISRHVRSIKWNHAEIYDVRGPDWIRFFEPPGASIQLMSLG